MAAPPGLTESELEEEFAEEEEEPREAEPGFAIGEVVFPVEKEKDFVDPSAVLINHADTYVGKNLGMYLSTQKTTGDDDEMEGEEELGDEEESLKNEEPKYWKLLGTLKNPKGPDPQFLWATVVYDDFEAYLREVLKCSVIIYDVTDDASQERIDEIRRVCDALKEKVPIFTMRRVFILISSLHSWSHTTRAKDEDYTFSESDYRRRRTKPLYRELQLLERYVVASGKMTKGMLKAYVVGAGAIYGGEEDPLHTWFKSAWHNAKYLPVYGPGKNLVPTIYVQDLAKVVQNLMVSTPKKQRYIIAVDPVVCTQLQIAKAISRALGSGKVRHLKESDIYLNKDLTTFQADQLMLDLPIESAFCKDSFYIEWVAENGFTDVMKRIVQEFRVARGLLPLKVIVAGPPGCGKSTVCRQLSDVYHVHHFDDDAMVEYVMNRVRQIVAEGKTKEAENEEEEEESEEDYETSAYKMALQLMTQVDENLQSSQKISDELLAKIYRYGLQTNPVNNQGYVLDGFPRTFQDAKTLFTGGERSGEDDDEEELGEDDREPLDATVLPDFVFFFEAPDDFLIQRLLKVPVDELLERHHEDIYPGSLEQFRKEQEEYERTFVAYLNEQEILYEPIDITTDTSNIMRGTTVKISHMLGKPRNYGLTPQEEAAIRNAQRCERDELNKRKFEDADVIAARLLEARRKNVEQWMEKLAQIKREEFEREEAALLPLRHYLMAHVVPTLTKGLIDITRLRPEDPIDYLAEFLFQNNPGGVNPVGEKLYF